MSPVNHGPNKPVPDIDTYMVLNEPETGVLLPVVRYPSMICVRDSDYAESNTQL